MHWEVVVWTGDTDVFFAIFHHTIVTEAVAKTKKILRETEVWKVKTCSLWPLGLHLSWRTWCHWDVKSLCQCSSVESYAAQLDVSVCSPCVTKWAQQEGFFHRTPYISQVSFVSHLQVVLWESDPKKPSSIKNCFVEMSFPASVTPDSQLAQLFHNGSFPAETPFFH